MRLGVHEGMRFSVHDVARLHTNYPDQPYQLKLSAIHVEATAETGCPACGVISTRVHSRRPQRLRDIPALRGSWGNGSLEASCRRPDGAA